MEVILLLMLAVVPPVVFMVYIYWMDRHEPECMRTILVAMALGALSTVPALVLQVALQEAPIFAGSGLRPSFFSSFLLVAPSEEFFKFLFIFLYLRNKPFYDDVNDGIVFYGAGALGFAMLENIFYVLGYGFTTGVLRAFSSIPLHTFCGVVIGYHAGLARFDHRGRPALLLLRGLFLAYLAHALYNTLVLSESFFALLAIPLLILVYFLGYRLLKHGQKLSIASLYREAPPGQAWDSAAAQAPLPAGPGENTVRLKGAPPGPPPLPGGYREINFTGASFAPPLAGPESRLSAEGWPAQRFLPLPPGVVNYKAEDIMVAPDGRRYLPPKKETFKRVIGLLLIGSSLVFWLLALLGYGSVSHEASFGQYLAGLLIITFIPLMVGFLLELSFRRRRREIIFIDREPFGFL